MGHVLRAFRCDRAARRSASNRRWNGRRINLYKNEPVLAHIRKISRFLPLRDSNPWFLCHASGIATAAAHVKLAAHHRSVYSFGSRRQHPSIARMIERAAWIGGVDGVSNTSAPEGMPVVGTMPHAFVSVMIHLRMRGARLTNMLPKRFPVSCYPTRTAMRSLSPSGRLPAGQQQSGSILPAHAEAICVRLSKRCAGNWIVMATIL